jgi:hypothetical protein
METTMFILIIILILFVPAAFLPMTLETFFSSNELSEMGVCLENIDASISDHQGIQSNAVAPKMTVACGNACV